MPRHIKPALLLFAALSFLTGVVYPLAITGIAQAVFPWQANGSLIDRNGRPIASELIGQSFRAPKHFWGRPSATASVPYNAAASAGSNLGPTNPELIRLVRERVAALRAADPSQAAPLPVDLVTASGSGLDPHISPAAAEYQVARVARARGLDEAAVREAVLWHTANRTLGLLGEPRVHVVRLNLYLDDLQR